MGVTCARKSQHRAQRCAARLNKLCMRLRHACVRRQVSREQEGLRACAELRRGSTGPRTATTRRRARRLGRRRCSGPRRCTHPAGRHVSAVRSEGASRPRRCGGSVACASKFTERERERAMGHGEKKKKRERSRLQSVSVSLCLPVSIRTSAWVGAVFARVHKDQRMGRCCQRLRTRAKVSRNYARALAPTGQRTSYSRIRSPASTPHKVP